MEDEEVDRLPGLNEEAREVFVRRGASQRESHLTSGGRGEVLVAKEGIGVTRGVVLGNCLRDADIGTYAG